MNADRAIENLLHLYAERIDAGDLEGVAELFREGAIHSPGSERPVEGYDAVLAMYRNFARIYEDGTPKTQHIITNCRIVVDEHHATAEAWSRFNVLQATPALALQTIIAGRYEDRFAFFDDAWRFTRRTMIPVLYGDVSQHLLTLPEGAPAS